MDIDIKNKIESILQDLKAGKAIILVDDLWRENEGDVVFLADNITAENVSFMINDCRGLICLTITEEKRAQLNIDYQVTNNEARFGTNFANSITHTNCPLDGISAESRAFSIREAAKVDALPKNFKSPGFIFPVVARQGGVLKRRGQTEGSVDLARLCESNHSESSPCAVICEILDEDGEILRGEKLNLFAKKHDLQICSIEEINQYRMRYDSSAKLIKSETLSIKKLLRGDLDQKNTEIIGNNTFELKIYEDEVDNMKHFALIFGSDNISKTDILCRIHSECLTGDIFGSVRCDCGEQFDNSIKMILENGSGILIYLRQEGRGIGLINKIKAYSLQDQGQDTIEANISLGFTEDLRDYQIAVKILKDLELGSIRLITNNPSKLAQLEKNGIKVSRVSLNLNPRPENTGYLKTKKFKMGHLLDL